MKAAWYEKNGAARDVLTVGEMDRPAPRPGEVLIRVHVSGVNPSDVKSRRGWPLGAPRIVPHSDGAGIVEAVGEGVPASRVGERVWLWNGQWKRAFGTAAEYIALPQEQAVPLPDNVGMDAGALFGIPALTAVHAVNLLGDVAGRTVLVTAAGASVGHYATQFLVARGARVIGTSSPRRAAHARAAGAAETIDYTSEDIAARLLDLTGGQGADGLIDMDFSSAAPLLSRLVRPHGIYVGYGTNNRAETPVAFADLMRRSLTLKLFLVYELLLEQRSKAIDDIHAALAAGSLSHTIGARFPLADIAAAHEAVEGGSVIGNVVVDLA